MSEPINTKQELHFSDRKGNTKRIFTNSVALFLRMIFVSIINIYSVRFILKGLGIIDYGVYYAISSVVLMGTFLIPVLSSSLQRFYSYFLGKKDHKALNSLFSISCNIVLAPSYYWCWKLSDFGTSKNISTYQQTGLTLPYGYTKQPYLHSSLRSGLSRLPH